MKYFFPACIISVLLFCISCSKTGFITSPEAAVSFSEDTLHFDTVFTTTGSVTQLVKIFNLNDQKLRLAAVKLMGGANSAYKINVDGVAGTEFSNIELNANDSIYVFVNVTINPNAANLPFIVQDSILVSYNGNNQFIQLQSFGQNAHFLRGRRVTTDSTWTNDLPYVILDSISVDENVSLTINKGCRIYNHANAPFIVNGSLKVDGDSTARVSFAGDRLDPVYKDLPGSWPGIVFTPTSKNNIINYATIRNAYQGIITQGTNGPNPKITLNQCIIENIFDAGIFSVASSITANNCLISNCGSNITIIAGGFYDFNYCTVVTYGNFYIQHKSPVLFISNSDIINTPYPIEAAFTNCIFYGEGGNVDNEIVVQKKPSTFVDIVRFDNILYKNKSIDIDTMVNNTSIKNQAPDFEKIDHSRLEYDFRLKAFSAGIDAGINIPGITIDLEGKPRPDSTSGIPDMGCYEKQ